MNSWDGDTLGLNAWGVHALDRDARDVLDRCTMAPTTPRPGAEALAELGARVRARREALGISQERLATRCGLHWTFIGQVERGVRNPSTLNLLKIAYGLESDAGVLVSGLTVPPIEQKPAW
jgi:DNA-binding XRE family transcriptional regulator